MGTSDIKDAFNGVNTGLQCHRVLVWLERDDAGKEWQRMAFHGMDADGKAFEVWAERHDPGADPTVIARAVARDYLQSKPDDEKEIE